MYWFLFIFLSISWVLRILWFSFSDIYLMSKKKWDWIWQYELWSELILYELRFTKKIVKLEKSFVYIWNGIFALGKKRYEKRFIFSWYKCIEDGLTHTKMKNVLVWSDQKIPSYIWYIIPVIFSTATIHDWNFLTVNPSWEEFSCINGYQMAFLHPISYYYKSEPRQTFATINTPKLYNKLYPHLTPRCIQK